MARFLIEVPHEADGDHRALLTVEVDSREEALRILPPMWRPQARIVRLSKFSMTHYGQMLHEHAPVAGRAAMPAWNI